MVLTCSHIDLLEFVEDAPLYSDFIFDYNGPAALGELMELELVEVCPDNHLRLTMEGLLALRCDQQAVRNRLA